MEHEEALVDHILKVSGNTSLPIHQDSGTTVVVFVDDVLVFITFLVHRSSFNCSVGRKE